MRKQSVFLVAMLAVAFMAVTFLGASPSIADPAAPRQHAGRAAVDFVHITDAHVNVSGSGRFREEGVRDLRRVVDAIRVIKPSFVIVTGDVTELGDEASLARYRSEIDRCGVPVYTVQGNHDRPRDPAVFNRLMGPTHPAFDVAGLRFVGLNYDRPEEALAVLEKQILTAPAAGIEQVFTFSHYPLLAPDAVAFSLSPGFASVTGEKAVRYLALAQQRRIAGNRYLDETSGVQDRCPRPPSRDPTEALSTDLFLCRCAGDHHRARPAAVVCQGDRGHLRVGDGVVGQVFLLSADTPLAGRPADNPFCRGEKHDQSPNRIVPLTREDPCPPASRALGTPGRGNRLWNRGPRC